LLIELGTQTPELHWLLTVLRSPQYTEGLYRSTDAAEHFKT